MPLPSHAANDFFRHAHHYLPDDCWETAYQLTFRLYQRLAKTDLICGRYEESEALLNQLIDHATSDVDKAEALAEQTTSLSSFGNFNQAIITANRGLAYFNKAIPEDPEQAQQRMQTLMADIAAQGDVWHTILMMPFTHERKSKIELAFYSELIPDLYMSGLVPQLYLSAAQSTQLCLSGGMDESVIYSFSIMGLNLGEQGQFELAFRYEDLAHDLCAKYPNTFGATRGMKGIVWCNMHDSNYVAASGSYFVLLAISQYYRGEYVAASVSLAVVENYLHVLTDNVLKRLWYVFRIVNQLRMTPRGQWQQCQADIRPLLKKVETWANLGVLLKPYLAFIYAEIARHQNQIRTARNRYLDAIASAHSQDYVLLAGHLHECVGDLLIESSSGNAEVYYAEARRLYVLCHAEAKIERLHKSYATRSIVANTLSNEFTIMSDGNELSTLPNLDINYLMKSALALSAETDLEQLLHKIMTVVLECSGAQHGYLLIKEHNDTLVVAENHIGKQPILQTQHISMTNVPNVCPAIVNYVFRTHEKVVLRDSCTEGDFQSVPEVQAMGLRSVLCLPVIKQRLLIGVLYLENRLSDGIFTREKTGMTELLTSHTAISLENARLLEETRRAYKELQESREHMMQMEKLSALGTLVGGVAHEINNPLMGVMNYVEFIQEKTTDVKIHKVLGQALNEIGRIKTIVRNMLIYVRTKSNAAETCHISDTITQTLSLLEGEFKKSNVHIDINLPDNLPAIQFGADSLQQVLINILLNARDALSETVAPCIDITAQLNQTKLELNLCDNGSGIPEAILSRIFDPFFTTKPPGKGTGLGLSVSYRLIEEAGGSIMVCNLPEGGCCMKLQFKIAE